MRKGVAEEHGFRRPTPPEGDIKPIIVPYPLAARSVTSTKQEPTAANGEDTASGMNHNARIADVHTRKAERCLRTKASEVHPPDVLGVTTKVVARSILPQLEQRDAKRHMATATFAIPSSPCPSLCMSVASSDPSTASSSTPPTPILSSSLGEPKIFIDDSEGGLPDDHTEEIWWPVSADPKLASKVNLSVSSPFLLCPSPLARRSSTLVPIRSSYACVRAGPDPFGAFAQSYFAGAPKASVVGANAVPHLYNFDIYAPSSTPPKHQQTQEAGLAHETNVNVRHLVNGDKNPDAAGAEGGVGPTLSQTPRLTVYGPPAEDLLKGPPRVRILLLPQEVERRASREFPSCSGLARGMRPLMLPLHVARRDSTGGRAHALPMRPRAHPVGVSRLSLPSAKPPASYPSPRARPSSDIPDLARDPGAPGDDIEIEKKAKRRSENLSDIISLLDGSGVTGNPPREDPRPQTTVAVPGTPSAEAARGTLEVPVHKERDGSQGKQEGVRAGGVRAAFGAVDGDTGYSRKLDDIASLLDLPQGWEAAPKMGSLEHAGEIRSREQLDEWGYAV